MVLKEKNKRVSIAKNCSMNKQYVQIAKDLSDKGR